MPVYSVPKTTQILPKLIASKKKTGYLCEEDAKGTKQLTGWVYRDLPSTGNANGIRGRHTFRIDEQILPGVCIRDLSKYSRVYIIDLSKFSRAGIRYLSKYFRV